MTNKMFLTIRCTDRPGLVAAVTGFLAESNFTIVESHQHQDADDFFMRIVFKPVSAAIPSLPEVESSFAPIASRFDMTATFTDASRKPRILLMVSRFGHCLHDLLYRWRAGQLPVEIRAVVSNHEDMRSFTEWNGIPYHHLPVTPQTKPEQERALLKLVKENHIDLVVLARYMQILSPDLCALLAGRCINIHHSFLPSFKGAKPYHQAHARGVKLIGATAHYVTTDLDEGPIIEQDTRRVSHSRTAEELTLIGQEVEASVLSRAVRWHVEQRVILNGSRTIVFD
ncbi:formyltetrahydrofolate deformylase [Novosphingobium sp. ERN07]|uniref:formyltetrahydrofolate deformylase n=2 Tax=Novosphingobium TaxID=165696 RepID=UPI000E48515C|nr:formyltetrahydrofolate deformylase [Novosphingobium sp. ERN07]AXU20237.1 formyltetrahydrofolate deformylase [Novosphingobium sp. THN1]NLR41106.1 formyltetrahydrofolate deformylase [Novosphingobium sp. ERW19]NLR70858.1 formyltetrahydrofolate deformylase [Novosphingobium sp. ERN07]